MQKRIISFISVIIAVITVFTGCDVLTFNSAENLVRPPKLSGDDGALQAAFESAIAEKGEYILRYPVAGSHRSAFVRYDCDGDKSDEAFVFYSLRAEEMVINMYVFDFADDKWEAKETTPGEGNDVYAIEFSDLNDDGISEILVGWSSMDSKTNKKLSVYSSDKSGKNMDYKVLAIETYTSMFPVDLDDDGEKEILVALINSTSDAYTTDARLLKMVETENNDFQINAVGQISLYSEITAISSITSGWADGRKYVYIDEAANDSYLTELVYWDSENNALTTAFSVDMLTVASCPTSRSLPLACADVDKDGEIEIPATTLMPESMIIRKNPETGIAAGHENVYIISWNKYNEGSFTPVHSYFSNEDDGFRFVYDSEVMSDWCVMFYPDERISQFFRLPETENENEIAEPELLFTITVVPAGETVSIGTYLISGENAKYTCEITEAGESAGLTRTNIVSYFSLI